jgi:hypothetical protein
MGCIRIDRDVTARFHRRPNCVSAAMPASQWPQEERRAGWLAKRARSLRWRITLALCASLAIHLATLVGLSIPEAEHVELGEGPPLVAHILPLAPAAAPEARAVAAHPRRSAKPTPKAPTAARPAPLPVDTVVPAPLPTEPVVPAAPPGNAAATEDARARTDAARPEPELNERPAEPPIAFPERIELEFDIAKNDKEGTVGRVVHRFERDGAHYVIRSVSTAAGIAALFVTGRYVQESRGVLTPQGFQPEQFVVRRGRVERSESTAFDWPSSRATVSADGNSREWLLQPGAQDQLSYLHQLSFLVADPSLASVMVTNGRRFYNAKIEILGRETIATGLGPVNALRVRSQPEGESRMDVWLATDYGNLPVKVRVRDRRGEELEQVLTAMKVK